MKKTLIAFAIAGLSIMAVACDTEQLLKAGAGEWFVNKVVAGDNAANAAVHDALDAYCAVPAPVRLSLRARYDGRIVVRCDGEAAE